MSGAAQQARAVRRVLGHWQIVAVTIAYFASALLMPRVDVPVGDDWFYARTVQEFVHGHGFHILDATVVTLILPAMWGALFGAAFGPSFVTLRWSTLTLVAVGGVAVYALCRTLGAGKRWAALAGALFVFNPLGYVLSNSFMSDAPFAAMLALAALFYVKGLAVAEERRAFVIAGSIAAAGAFLVRQQGALIPLAVGAHLFLRRGLRINRANSALLLRVGGIPAFVGLVYAAWLRVIHGVPAGQHLFAGEADFLYKPAMAALALRLAVVCVVYAGLFTIPIAMAALIAVPRMVRALSRWAWLAFLPSASFAIVGAHLFARDGRLMPYVPQYVAEWGLGPADLIGGRPIVTGHRALVALTVACVIGVVVGLLAVAHAAASRRAPAAARSSRAGCVSGSGLIGSILAGQLVGIVPPSLHFQDPVPAAVLVFTLDRYLLPMLPLVICLFAWAVVDLKVPSWPAWIATVGFAVASVAGTHDYLVFQGVVWDAATHAQHSGIEPRHLDAGAQWDAAHLYEDGVPVPKSLPNRPWWVNQFAWEIDPQWIIASTPVAGYVEVKSTPYSTWLRPHDKRVILLRRIVAGPATPGS